jgi:hypothetical protein
VPSTPRQWLHRDENAFNGAHFLKKFSQSMLLQSVVGYCLSDVRCGVAA